MKLIDTNALVVLILGTIDERLISSHRRTSIYEVQDYLDLVQTVGELSQLVVLPNVWTETDNLLNGSLPRRKWEYISIVKQVVANSTERFLSTQTAVDSAEFFTLGITDSLLLHYGTQCDLLITSDSALSDLAIAKGIKVFDVVANRNRRL
jgi:hypothetical protein